MGKKTATVQTHDLVGEPCVCTSLPGASVSPPRKWGHSHFHFRLSSVLRMDSLRQPCGRGGGTLESLKIGTRPLEWVLQWLAVLTVK